MFKLDLSMYLWKSVTFWWKRKKKRRKIQNSIYFTNIFQQSPLLIQFTSEYESEVKYCTVRILDQNSTKNCVRLLRSLFFFLIFSMMKFHSSWHFNFFLSSLFYLFYSLFFFDVCKRMYLIAKWICFASEPFHTNYQVPTRGWTTQKKQRQRTKKTTTTTTYKKNKKQQRTKKNQRQHTKKKRQHTKQQYTKNKRHFSHFYSCISYFLIYLWILEFHFSSWHLNS